jgi:tRNA modification GTPase
MHLVAPWRVVFAGPPNVGKSSLINALAGYQRAIVSPTPGTTRDVVTLTTAIDGWPVELADTAGLRSTDDELEAAGVELAQSALATADLAVLVQDATNPAATSRFDPRAVPPRVIHVLNKIDLVSAGDLPAFDSTSLPTQLATSAETGAGIADLAAAIGRSLVPNPPACGDAVPFTAQQVELLTVASNAIQRQHAAAAIEALQSLLPSKVQSPN